MFRMCLYFSSSSSSYFPLFYFFSSPVRVWNSLCMCESIKISVGPVECESRLPNSLLQLKLFSIVFRIPYSVIHVISTVCCFYFFLFCYSSPFPILSFVDTFRGLREHTKKKPVMNFFLFSLHFTAVASWTVETVQFSLSMCSRDSLLHYFSFIFISFQQ